jgi:predicted amidohydrolase
MVRDARVAACQFEPTIGDVDANVDAVDRSLSSLPDTVAVAVFPELAATGYDLDTARELATAVPGALTDSFVDVAREHETTIVVGVPERDADALYNTLVVIDADGVTATYRKQYPWGDESGVFATGDGPTTVDTEAGTLGLALCYDLNFPELGLDYARAGCDVLAVSAAWRRSFQADWRLLTRARALDGPYYVAGSNHVGDQAGRIHAGGSLVADPTGTVLSEVKRGHGHAVAPVEGSRLETARERNPVRQTRNWNDSP